MADLATMVLKVRRKVNDWKAGITGDQTFVDVYYEDAIDFGLGRFNCDTGNAYTLISLPAKFDWLIDLLAAIEMCELFATISNNVAASGGGSPLRTQVNGLEVWYQAAKEATAADLVKLCADLEDKYMAWLSRNGEDIIDAEDRPITEVFTVLREAVGKNRAIDRRELDRPLDAVVGVAVTAVTAGNKVTWGVVYSTQFARYDVERILSGEDFDEDAVVVTQIRDNHCAKYTDTSTLAAGTYEYRVVVYNRNNLETASVSASIVVT